MTERMLTAIANPHVDVLGHCTGRMVTGNAQAARVAVRRGGGVRRLRRARRRASRSTPGRSGSTHRDGCCGWPSTWAASSPIDTDAHAPGQLDWLDNGCSRAADCGVPADRVLNTWPVERVLNRTR